MLKPIIFVLLLLLLMLQYDLWVGNGGLRDVKELQHINRVQVEENGRLSERNQSLAAEVQDLKEGLDAVEERARSDIGMIKKGEVFYQIVERGEVPSVAPQP